MHYVNLISPAARARQIRRARIRQWRLVLTAVVLLLVPAVGVAWWPVYRGEKRIAALEMQYEPTRQLMAETCKLRKQIDAARSRGRLALALGKQKPMLTLLGLVGQAVAETEEEVVLATLTFKQPPGPWSQPDSTRLELSGIGKSGQGTSILTDQLRARLPATEVAILQARPVTKRGELRSEFTIEAAFP